MQTTGKQIWKTYTIPEEPKLIRKNSLGVDYMGPSGAGVWTTPIVDTKRRALYFGTGNSFLGAGTYFRFHHGREYGHGQDSLVEAGACE